MPEDTIRQWLIACGSRERTVDPHDLHLDAIDKRYRDPSTWLNRGLCSLNRALQLREEMSLSLSLALGIALTSNRRAIGLHAESLREIKSEFDSSPPSLYAIHRLREAWVREEELELLDGRFDALISQPTNTYFREWYDVSDGEYRRVLWILG